MKRFAIVLIAGSFVLSALTAPAIAKATKPVAGMKCPACGMMMPTHKTATMDVPVKINGKTYYCCSKCAAGKAALAKMHAKKTK
jgi:YHS domain-containing protein